MSAWEAVRGALLLRLVGVGFHGLDVADEDAIPAHLLNGGALVRPGDGEALAQANPGGQVIVDPAGQTFVRDEVHVHVYREAGATGRLAAQARLYDDVRVVIAALAPVSWWRDEAGLRFLQYRDHTLRVGDVGGQQAAVAVLRYGLVGVVGHG